MLCSSYQPNQLLILLLHVWSNSHLVIVGKQNKWYDDTQLLKCNSIVKHFVLTVTLFLYFYLTHTTLLFVKLKNIFNYSYISFYNSIYFGVTMTHLFCCPMLIQIINYGCGGGMLQIGFLILNCQRDSLSLNNNYRFSINCCIMCNNFKFKVWCIISWKKGTSSRNKAVH